jgi:hypothetical protein
LFAQDLNALETVFAEGLSTDEAEDDFCGVQPTRMLGRVVKFETPGQSVCLGSGEDGTKGGRMMRVEVVYKQMDCLRLRIGFCDSHQLATERVPGTICRDLSEVTPGLWLGDPEDVRFPQPNVLVVPVNNSPACTQGDSLLSAKKEGFLIKNQNGLFLIVWTRQETENGEHLPDEVRRQNWNDPHFFPATA